MFHYGAYVHQYVKFGSTLDEFQEAFQNVEQGKVCILAFSFDLGKLKGDAI
jgi:hypothetical protein